MRVFQKLGSVASVLGLLLVLAGGMSVRGGPDGTWVQVNVVHAIGGVTIACGSVLSVVAAFARVREVPTGGSNASGAQ